MVQCLAFRSWLLQILSAHVKSVVITQNHFKPCFIFYTKVPLWHLINSLVIFSSVLLLWSALLHRRAYEVFSASSLSIAVTLSSSCLRFYRFVTLNFKTEMHVFALSWMYYCRCAPLLRDPILFLTTLRKAHSCKALTAGFFYYYSLMCAYVWTCTMILNTENKVS